MNLIKIFNNQNRWLKNARAKYKDGSDVPFTHPWNENQKEPWAFSLHGAVAFYTDPESESRSKTMSKLSKAISQYTGKRMFVAEFNDSPDTSFDDLISVLKMYSKIK